MTKEKFYAINLKQNNREKIEELKTTNTEEIRKRLNKHPVEIITANDIITYLFIMLDDYESKKYIDELKNQPPQNIPTYTEQEIIEQTLQNEKGA